MNVLILSCNTGEGHNSAAKAIREQLERDGHTCQLKDALSFASPGFSRFICDSYRQIVMRTPMAFGVMFKLSKITATSKVHSPVYLANMVATKKLYEFVAAGGFDAIICTHVFAAQSATHIKHKYKLDLPLYVVSTDYGFCPYFEELDVKYYFIPMEQLRSDFLRRGVPNSKIVVSGIPVASKFINMMDKRQAREQLSVEIDAKVCVVMSGSMGFGDIYDMLDYTVKDMPENTRIFVLVGNNTKLREGIDSRYDRRVSTVGFTDKVDVYMAAADIVVTKPGGLTSSEAMVANIPLVLAKPIPGVESENYLMLTGIGAAVSGKKSKQAAESICRLLSDESACRQVTDAQLRYISRNSAEIISKTVCEV